MHVYYNIIYIQILMNVWMVIIVAVRCVLTLLDHTTAIVNVATHLLMLLNVKVCAPYYYMGAWNAWHTIPKSKKGIGCSGKFLYIASSSHTFKCL